MKVFLHSNIYFDLRQCLLYWCPHAAKRYVRSIDILKRHSCVNALEQQYQEHFEYKRITVFLYNLKVTLMGRKKHFLINPHYFHIWKDTRQTLLFLGKIIQCNRFCLSANLIQYLKWSSRRHGKTTQQFSLWCFV